MSLCIRLSCAAVLFCTTTAGLFAAPVGAGFTYQGELKSGGVPVNGSVSLSVNLWDGAGSNCPPTGGTQIGATQSINPVTVVNGLFTVVLNDSSQFGTNPFDGGARWLQFAVNGTTLCPRQALTVTPYAQYAVRAGTAGPWQLSGTDVYYNGGRVGAGTATPHGALEVGNAVMVVGPPNDCCSSHGGPGCSDPACQSAVCGQDPVCCGLGHNWDVGCATEASSLCGGCPSPATRVGIGTTTPGATLEIVNSEGALAAMLDLTGAGFTARVFKNASGNFCIRNNIAGSASYAELHDNGAWTVGSDQRFKWDVRPLAGLLERTLALRPVSYYLVAQDLGRDPERHMGLIGQDVECVLPALVYGRGEEPRTVDYGGLTVAAIGAIQEQQRIIDSQ